MNISTIEHGEELLKQSSRGPWTLNIGRFGYPASIDCAIPNEPVVYRGIEGDGGVCMKEDAEFIVWLQNHASELLQMAREVERMKKALKEATGSLNKGTNLMREYEGGLIAGEVISALQRAVDEPG